MKVLAKNSTACSFENYGNNNEDKRSRDADVDPAQIQYTSTFQQVPQLTLVALTGKLSPLSAQQIARKLFDHLCIELEKSPAHAFSVLTRAKSLADDPIVKQIYEKSDYLRELYGRAKDFKDQQELRDEFWDNRKKILSVLNIKEEFKIWGTALGFFPDTPWIKALARYYAKITGTTEPDATMQFGAYFTYPVAARPETKSALDAFMSLLANNS